MNLLFVCTGNICRSAAAHQIAQLWVAHAAAAPIEIGSAGTRARRGRPLHPFTAAALERRGITPVPFGSSPLEPSAVEAADLVLTMTAEHREAVVSTSPRAMHKVFTLREAAVLSHHLPTDVLAGHPGLRPGQAFAAALAVARRSARGRLTRLDIEDPIEGPPELHARVVAEIADALSAVLPVASSAAGLVGGATVDSPMSRPQASGPPTAPTLRISGLPPVPPPRSRLR
jgi:protein-tyrosine-phosphatase